MERKNTWVAFSLGCLFLAFITSFLPVGKLYDNLTGTPSLNGLHTDFTLSPIAMHSHLGQTASWQSLQNKPLLVTAGFTHCKHSCPMTMNFYQRLNNALMAEDLSANFVLFTVDRERDTSEKLNEYLAAINPEFIGLRADTKQGFDQVVSDLKQSVTAVGGDVDIAHSSNVYLLHPDVDGMVIYTHHDVESMLHDFKLLSSNIQSSIGG